MKYSLFFILFLSAFSAYSGSDCEWHIRHLEGCINGRETVGEELSCLRGNIRDVREFCYNHGDGAYEGQLNKVKKVISEKYDGASAPEKEALSNKMSKLDGLIKTNRQYSSLFMRHATRISELALEVKGAHKQQFDVFKRDLALLIQNANNANTTTHLNSWITQIKLLLLNESNITSNILMQIRIEKNTLSLLESRYLNAIKDLAEDEAGTEIVESIQMSSEIIDEMINYLTARLDLVNQKITELTVALDERMNALINYKVQQNVDERMQNNVVLQRSTSFLEEVNVVVDEYRANERSNYRNLPYMYSKFQAVERLMDLIEMCASNNTENWQSLGCNRATRFASTARQLQDTTIPTLIRYGLRSMSFLESTPEYGERINYIHELLQSGRIEEASLYFDRLLDVAGG